MKKLLVVVGTRPNFIKVTRMRAVAAQRGDWEVRLVHTGQHFDERMSTVFFEQFGLVPDHWLGIPRARRTRRWRTSCWAWSRWWCRIGRMP